MENTMSDDAIEDMMSHVLERQPDQFNAAFNDAMLERIAAALDAKKQEVAQNYFNSSGEEEDDTNIEQENEEQNGQDS